MSDGFLVLVRGGGIDVPVADLESVSDGLLGLVRGDLEDAETDDRHFRTVVQRHIGRLGGHSDTPWSFGLQTN